jgi:hypothetical protein
MTARQQWHDAFIFHTLYSHTLVVLNCSVSLLSARFLFLNQQITTYVGVGLNQDFLFQHLCTGNAIQYLIKLRVRVRWMNSIAYSAVIIYSSIASRKSNSSSSRPTGRGLILVTRCCGSVPSTRAGTSSRV